MPFNINKVFGVQAQALAVRSKRSEVIANNIANVDTPGFKAKDVDFNAMMQRFSGSAANKLTMTNEKHYLSNNDSPLMQLKFRDDGMVSIDGNNVDKDIETVAFAKNSAMYQASLTFLGGSIKAINKAFKGE